MDSEIESFYNPSGKPAQVEQSSNKKVSPYFIYPKGTLHNPTFPSHLSSYSRNPGVVTAGALLDVDFLRSFARE
eukprot:2021442-Rhodomonas_salina.1